MTWTGVGTRTTWAAGRLNATTPVAARPFQRELIERAGQGEGLLVTAGRRVLVNLCGHTSPYEFEVFNTDRDERAVENSVDRRNGHAATTAAYAARR